MRSEEAVSLIKSRGKTVLTFFGYSGMGYEDEQGMLDVAHKVLSGYAPEKTLVNIGVTEVGIGAIYSLAKSMGFETAGIVTTLALEFPEDISRFADHICFIKDDQWGGYLPNSEELSPTSRAMVDSSDILVAIGGNEVSRDELLEGRKQGKPIHFHPADGNHEMEIRRAKRRGLPEPTSFLGAVHEVFGK